MMGEDLRLAEALGYVCAARAQVAQATALLDELHPGPPVSPLAVELISTLAVLEGVQRGIMVQIADTLLRAEERET